MYEREIEFSLAQAAIGAGARHRAVVRELQDTWGDPPAMHENVHVLHKAAGDDDGPDRTRAGAHPIPELARSERAFYDALTEGQRAAYDAIAGLVNTLHEQGRGWAGVDPFALDEPIEEWKRKAFNALATRPMQAYMLGQLLTQEALQARIARPLFPADREAIKYLEHQTFNEIGAGFDRFKADLKTELIQGMIEGRNPRETARALARTFEDNTSDFALLAITESTRAEAQGRLRELDDADIKYALGSSAHDSRTCFPAGTMVATPTGDVPIQALRAGDAVLTPKGQRQLVSSMSRPNTSGRWAAFLVNARWVIATHDHLIWTLGSGWKPAGNLCVGDWLQTSNDEGAQVDGVVDFILTKPDNAPPCLDSEGRLSDIPRSHRTPMPVGSVGFDHDAQRRNSEVESPSPNLVLLLKYEVRSGQDLTNAEFESGLTAKHAVAAKTTEPPSTSGRWSDALGFAAIKADHERCGPSTAFGTVPIPLESNPKSFPAPSARAVDRWPACERAHVVASRYRRENGKLSTALLTDLYYDAAGSGERLPKSPTALISSAHLTGAFNATELSFALANPCELNATLFAIKNPLCIKRLVAQAATKPLVCASQDLLAAMAAASPSDDMPVVRRIVNARSDEQVYDLTVNEDHVFFADGVLVHNCDACLELIDGKKVPIAETLGKSNFGRKRADWIAVIPCHPRCRCVWLPWSEGTQAIIRGES